MTDSLSAACSPHIQPFLRPVPPSGSELLATILSPIGYLLGAVKTILLAALALVYLVLVQGACLILVSGLLASLARDAKETRYQFPIPPLHRVVTGLFTAILARLALLLVGLYWIPVDVVARKRG